MKLNSLIVAAFVVLVATATISAMALLTLAEPSYGIMQKAKQTSEQKQAQSVSQLNFGKNVDQENENKQVQENDQFIKQKARCSGELTKFTC